MKSDKNLFDSYISYNLSNEQGSSGGTPSRSRSGSGWIKLITVLLIFYAVYTLIGLFTPACAAPGCDKSPADGSRYCALHKYSYPGSSRPAYIFQ